MQKRIRQKKQQDYRQKRERGDTEKWVQTDSPEIPDRGGETSEVSGLHSGVRLIVMFYLSQSMFLS